MQVVQDPRADTLARALQSVGGGIDKFQQERQRRSIADQFDANSTLGKILSQKGGLQIAQQLTPLLKDTIKTEQMSNYSKSIRDKYSPSANTVPGSISQSLDDNNNGMISPDESGLNESAVAPGPTSGEFINTPQGPVLKDEYFDTPYGKYHPQQIQEMMMSPNPADQKEAAMINEYLAKTEERKAKKETEFDKRAFETNKPYWEELNKKRNLLPQQDAVLFGIRDAILNSGGSFRRLKSGFASVMPGEMGDLILDKNQQQLASFVKDYFMEDLKGLPGGTRLNQYIERTLKSALQSPTKPQEANQIITEFQQYKHDLISKQIEISDKLRNQYLKAGLEPPRNFQEMVNKQLASFAKQRQQELANTMKDVKSGKWKSPQALNMPFAKRAIQDELPKPNHTWILNPKGEPVQAPNNELQKWLDSGGVLIK